MRARMYSPALGRFIQRDPIGYYDSMNLYSYVGNNAVNFVDPEGLTWESNINYLSDWLTGSGESNRVYTPGSVELGEMKNSVGAQALRNAFANGGGKNVTDFSYGTGQAAWDTLLNPFTADWSKTSAEVGGFAGATAIKNECGNAVTYTISNVSGAKSFFYHLASNRQGRTGPMRNINQTFTWTEKL